MNLTQMISTAPPHAAVLPGGKNERLIELLAHVAAADQEALAVFYDATNRFVFGLVSRIIGDPSVAEEITLDVYMQVWRKAATYDLERGSPLSWMVPIARSRAIDYLRAQRRKLRPAVSLTDEATQSPANKLALSSPATKAEETERRQLVRSALRALPRTQREVVELAFFNGYTHAELAAILAIPLGTVKTRVRLGLQKLRDLLQPQLANDLCH